MLARGARPKVRSRHQNRALGVRLLVENEVRVIAPGRKERVVIPGLGHALEELGRNDLVGVDVTAAKRNPDAVNQGDLVH